ncbi:centrosomal protein of 290 kDa-like isoform X2 [Dreissena polymorpha]|uniref:Uncharacterized protein n=1 Tax=Dreissena polymorpha TaxID=45954 RepID=A0A9D4NCV5_DREPO|nr:centrosomal protein of 290 kDa-like isoform X2 [Dreissena polymorpha]KAH3894093.1 hypothetical protein DPMN_018251 [Dreissena polymorpha]
MAYPDIHACMKLTSENEELKMKLQKIRRQRDEAVNELKQIKEASKVHELLRNYVTTRDEYVQTDARTNYLHMNRLQKKKEEVEEDSKKSSTLLSMHSALMKRYEKEVKQNMTHIETITNLNLGMIELEKKLKERTDEVSSLEREVKILQIQAKSKARRKSANRGHSPESSGDEDDLTKMRKENRKMRKDIGKLKQELSGLDHGFFEEIEDIKFALQQSAKLNSVYEKTLRKMCMQFGVPYPNPEKAIKMTR